MLSHVSSSIPFVRCRSSHIPIERMATDASLVRSSTRRPCAKSSTQRRMIAGSAKALWWLSAPIPSMRRRFSRCCERISRLARRAAILRHTSSSEKSESEWLWGSICDAKRSISSYVSDIIMKRPLRWRVSLDMNSSWRSNCRRQLKRGSEWLEVWPVSNSSHILVSLMTMS